MVLEIQDSLEEETFISGECGQEDLALKPIKQP